MCDPCCKPSCGPCCPPTIPVPIYPVPPAPLNHFCPQPCVYVPVVQPMYYSNVPCGDTCGGGGCE